MNATRAIIMSLGIVSLLVGAYLLYFEARLDQWVSIGILTGGILLFVGVAVMMFAGGARTDPATVAPAQPTTVVQDNRPVERNNPR